MKRLQYKKLFLVYTILLVLLAMLPINNGESVLNNNYLLGIRLDYFLHFAIVFSWMFMLRKYAGVSFRERPFTAFLVLLAGLTFALANEWIQVPLSYRAYNVNDLVANGLGVLIGSLFFFR